MSLNRYATARDKNEPAIVAAFRAAGARVHLLSSAGIPDLLVGWQGRWILVEVKTKTGTLTEGQQLFFGDCAKSGLPVFVARSTDDIEGILNEC